MQAIFERYAIVAVAAGACRSTYYANAGVFVDGKTRRPLLLTEKAAFIATNACFNVWVFPYTLFEDARTVEARVRGITTKARPWLVHVPHEFELE